MRRLYFYASRLLFDLPCHKLPVSSTAFTTLLGSIPSGCPVLSSGMVCGPCRFDGPTSAYGMMFACKDSNHYAEGTLVIGAKSICTFSSSPLKNCCTLPPVEGTVSQDRSAPGQCMSDRRAFHGKFSGRRIPSC